MKHNCCDLVLVFVVTVAWDVVLRMFSMKKIKFLGIERINWIVALRGYFETHTLLAAALIAGICGVFAKLLIDLVKFKTPIAYGAWILFVSAAVGIPMRYSGLFPHLKKFYYDPLPYTTIASDAFSGIVVAATISVLKKMFR